MVSSEIVVVGARAGASASKVGKAAEDEVVDTDDDRERVASPGIHVGASSSANAIDYLVIEAMRCCAVRIPFVLCCAVNG